MRIAELSRRGGVSIPTIKYYLREGLLPSGEPTGPNQAAYGQHHLDRLRLIRVLREVGGLSVAAAGEVIATLDDPPESTNELMGRAHCAIIRPSSHDPADPAWQQARAEVDTWLHELGWRVSPGAPARDQLADVFLALRRLDRTDLVASLPRYAQAALAVAEPEVASAAAQPDQAAVMSAVVTGTVLGEALLTSLRLLAHEHVSATRAAPSG